MQAGRKENAKAFEGTGQLMVAGIQSVFAHIDPPEAQVSARATTERPVDRCAACPASPARLLSAAALTSRPPRSLAARCSQVDSTAPPAIKSLSPSEQAAKEAAQHEELEGLLAIVAESLSPELLAKYLAALDEHHATEAARDGGLSSLHAAAHKYLSGLVTSELARLEMEGEGALVSSDFVTSFAAKMEAHEAKFDAVRSRATCCSLRLSMPRTHEPSHAPTPAPHPRRFCRLIAH